jgi:hypothetical protein
MKSVKNKETGKYGVSFNSDDRMADFYVDLWFTITKGKGTYTVPHLKLVMDLYNTRDLYQEANDVVVIMYIDEKGMITERTNRKDFVDDFIELDNRSVDVWEKELVTEYKIKKRYYEERELDFFEFWLNYHWDKNVKDK